MLTIRLQRVGKKNSPSFRIVTVDSRRSSKSNAIKDVVGFYNPKSKECRFDAQKINKALSVGAKTSETVHNLLVRYKIIKEKKKNVLHLSRIAKKKKKEGAPSGGQEAKEQKEEQK